MAEFANFAICTERRSRYGGEPILIPHPPESYEYRYLSMAIYISLCAMRTPQCQEIMTDSAFDYDNYAHQGRLFRGNRRAAWRRVRQFMGMIMHRYPLVCISLNPDDPGPEGGTGFHSREPWRGHLDDFDPRHQMVAIVPHVRISSWF